MLTLICQLWKYQINIFTELVGYDLKPVCVLVLQVTVMHSMQAGYMEKAQKYTDKALMQIGKLKSMWLNYLIYLLLTFLHWVDASLKVQIKLMWCLFIALVSWIRGIICLGPSVCHSTNWQCHNFLSMHKYSVYIKGILRQMTFFPCDDYICYYPAIHAIFIISQALIRENLTNENRPSCCRLPFSTIFWGFFLHHWIL